MAKDKREVVRLTRVKTRPFYVSGDDSAKIVRGYLNKHKEFSQYDYEYQQGATGLTVAQQAAIAGPSPIKFFSLPQSEYRELNFIMTGIFEKFDRNIHSLDSFKSRLYIVQSDGNAKLFDSTDTTLYKTQNKIPPTKILKFRINPLNLKLEKKKLFKKIRTRAGWAFQHWGPEIGKIVLKGTTGNLMPNPTTQFGIKDSILGNILFPESINDTKPTITNSPALKAFKDLEQWYDEDQSEESVENGYLTALEYRDRVYIGHFASFDLEEKGDQPFQIFYTLVFLVHYDTNNLQSATTRAKSQITRNEKTLAVIKKLKGINESG